MLSKQTWSLPFLTQSWNDQSESDTDQPQEAVSREQGSAEKPRMRKKVTQSKKESKIIVDYNDDQKVKTQKTVNSRDVDTWNHDKFENGAHPGERSKPIGQNRGQRGHGFQSEQNQRGHGSRSEQNMRGHGSKSEQNHRGNGSQPQQNYR